MTLQAAINTGVLRPENIPLTLKVITLKRRQAGGDSEKTSQGRERERESACLMQRLVERFKTDDSNLVGRSRAHFCRQRLKTITGEETLENAFHTP